MSALGQKQICAAQNGIRFGPNSDHESGHPNKVMSALPPKADMCSAIGDVCFGPIADIATVANQCDRGTYDRLGALLTVSERAICPVAKGAVEIALAGRDHFGTAVTLALILFPRRAPLRHRFVPHCPCLLHFCLGRNNILIKTRTRDTRFLHCGPRTDYVMQNPARPAQREVSKSRL